jgi:lipoyl(octanoyl) transferase
MLGTSSRNLDTSQPSQADRILETRRLGLIAYDEALKLQRSFVEARREGRVADLLLLLQHPHVLTFGVNTGSSRAHILASPARLVASGVTLHEAGRGGDVTYHGPGQLVGYPVIDLKPDRRDVHRYVRDLEEVMLRTAASFGVTATRVKGLTGVWCGDEKLGAVGVRISRWITSHGFALNIDPDLGYFDMIVPCGIPDRGVTSLARLLRCNVDMQEVEDVLIGHFAEVFSRKLLPERVKPVSSCSPLPPKK